MKERFFPRILTLRGSQGSALVHGLTEILSTEDHDNEVRWDAALVVEFLVRWDPLRVPAELILTMTEDSFFGVRSSAAVCYYYLAASSLMRCHFKCSGGWPPCPRTGT
jgi:hypothetical protein